MDPEIVSREAFTVLGSVSRIAEGSESPEVYRDIWSDFESLRSRITPRVKDLSYYGISFPSVYKGMLDYMAGMAVDGDVSIPEGMQIRKIPAADYAVFACPIPAIGGTYQSIFRDWLPHSKFEYHPLQPSFEQYPPDGARNQIVRIHIPVRRKKQP